MAEHSWYVRRGSAVRGPYPHALIERLVAAGKLVAGDEFSADLDGWRPIEVLCPPTADDGAGDERSRGAELQPAARAPIADRYQRLVGPPGYRRQLQLAILATLGVALVVAGVVLRGPVDESGPRCDAAPAPAVNWSNCSFVDLAAPRADLSGLQARNATLRGARLFGARLGNADLAYATLAGADLSYSDLHAAVMMGADLRGADLGNADLRGADLRYADLGGAKVARAALEGALLGHALWTDGRKCAEGAVGVCTAASGGQASTN